MALTFLGETDFVKSGQPQWQQSLWDLDSLVIPYSGAITGLNAFLNGLVKGEPSDIDADMLLVDWRVSGSKQYPTVDLIYTGKKNGVLPSVKRSNSNPPQSVSSTRSPVFGAPMSATLEFYAVSSRATWFTYDAPGELNTATDPVGTPTPRFLITSDTTYGPGTIGFDESLAFFFSIYITDTLDSEEIVPNKLWQNQEIKTKYYGPFAFVMHSFGNKAIGLYSAGTGYTIGDGLSFSFGTGSASINVTAVDGAGGVADFSIGSDSISASIFLVMEATGGSGSGAAFQFWGA